MKTTLREFVDWLSDLSDPDATVEIEGITNSVTGPFTAKRVVCARSNETGRLSIFVNPMGTHVSDEFYQSNVVVSVFTGEKPPSGSVVHGKDCHKVPHGVVGAHLHDSDDDRPYDVDGVLYCGRCHQFINTRA